MTGINYLRISVSPKGWYHGTPPSFNFKVYAEKHCFITRIKTLLTKRHVSLMHSPPLIFIMWETLQTCMDIIVK